MKRYRITENRLRQIIRESVKCYLAESRTSGSHFSDQIHSITKMVVEKLQSRDYKSIYVPIKISLSSFFTNVDSEYLKPEEYEIWIYFNDDLDDDFEDDDDLDDDLDAKKDVTGDFNMWRESPIHIEVGIEAEYSDIYITIEHEVTHLVDFLIQRCKHYRSHQFYANLLFRKLPPEIVWILYYLWSTTEFNAFKISKQEQKDENFNDLMGYIEMAYNNNDKIFWDDIKKVVATTDKIYNMKPLQFKNYFIKTSLNKLKKYVKKYY